MSLLQYNSLNGMIFTVPLMLAMFAMLSLLLVSCGEPPVKNMLTISDDVSLKPGWSVVRHEQAHGQFPAGTVVVRRDNPIELIDGRSVQPQHALIPFAGEAARCDART